MIRRDVLHSELDHWVVKWSLIAASLALVIGCYAETVHRREIAAGGASAVQVDEAPAKTASAAS
ncbi:MAG TPA: hypothetical protein VMN60_13095 [Longimicrobiales bacterium]|nr:hypothetical protein [Longimicrobiales bacterium]